MRDLPAISRDLVETALMRHALGLMRAAWPAIGGMLDILDNLAALRQERVELEAARALQEQAEALAIVDAAVSEGRIAHISSAVN